MGLKTWLGLKKSRSRKSRKDIAPERCEILRPWPQSLAASVGPIVTFGIPLRSRAASADWELTQQLLAAALQSVLRQNDTRFRILICGHDFPEIAEARDDRIEFVRALWPAPIFSDKPWEQRTRGVRDKVKKRQAIRRRLLETGAGFYMQLDADDLVHRDVASFALQTEHGCIIERGYALDHSARRIAPIPGAWSVDFDRVCGSCAVVRYDPADLGGEHSTTLFEFSSAHQSLRGAHDEMRRPLAPVPFPAAVYVLNTRQNISFMYQRSSIRGEGLLENIRENEILSLSELTEIDEAFGRDLAKDAHHGDG